MNATMLFDKDIRDPLFAFLDGKHAKVRYLEEVPFGSARADAVMVLEDQLVGIEIKSDADSYARLPQQIGNYDRYFDKNYLVIGVSHVNSVLDHVPLHWGVITAEIDNRAFDFYVMKEAADNPSVCTELRLQLLWRSELVHILLMNKFPKYAKRDKYQLRQILAESVDPVLLKKQVSEELFERDYTIWEK